MQCGLNRASCWIAGFLWLSVCPTACGWASSSSLTGWLEWMAEDQPHLAWTFDWMLGCRLASWQAFWIPVCLTDSKPGWLPGWLVIISGPSLSYVVSSWNWKRDIWLLQSGRCGKTLLTEIRHSEPGCSLPAHKPHESITNYSISTSSESIPFSLYFTIPDWSFRLCYILTQVSPVACSKASLVSNRIVYIVWLRRGPLIGAYFTPTHFLFLWV